MKQGKIVGTVFSAKDMLGKLTFLEKVMTPIRVKRGLAKAGAELLRDSVELVPKAPVDTTSLIGSASVFVNGAWWSDSPFGVPGTKSFRGVDHDPAEYTDYKTHEGEGVDDPDWFVADVVFNAPYAADQHEIWPNKQGIRVQGAGIHFISFKIGLYYGHYMQTITSEIYLGK